jgi:phage I-like protein
MAKVNSFLIRTARRLACSRFWSSRPFVTVVASAATDRAGELDQVAGSALVIALEQDGSPRKWVRLIPPGQFTCNDGRGPFRNGDPQAVIAASKTWLNGLEAPGDYNHATEYKDQTGSDARASGWVKDWRVVDGAIEALVEWTKNAAAAIAGKEFRYVSPVFDALKSNGEVYRIKRFALTNTPAIDELPAIAASRRTETEESNVSKLIAQALGLPETASETEMVAAASNLRKNYDGVIASAGAAASASVETIVAAIREKPDASKWIAASEYQRVSGELTTVTASRDELQKKLAGDEVETVFAAAMAEGKVTKGQQKYWTETCAAVGSAEPLKKFLETAVVIVKPGEETGTARPGGELKEITASQLNAAEIAHCRKFDMKPESYARELTSTIAAGGIRPLAS